MALVAIGLGPIHRAKLPHDRLQDLERASGFATLAITAGIAIEFLSTLNHWSATFLLLQTCLGGEHAISLVANAVIFLGLAVEYLVIFEAIETSRADRIEADREVADAINRASNAEIALIEHKTPRRETMTAQNKAIVTGLLQPFAGTQFDTGMGGGPSEVIHFCWDLEEVLLNANWVQVPWRGVGGPLTLNRNLRPAAGMIMADNVEIQVDPIGNANLLAMQGLIDALGGIGISIRQTDYNFANLNVDALHILIGPKL